MELQRLILGYFGAILNYFVTIFGLFWSPGSPSNHLILQPALLKPGQVIPVFPFLDYQRFWPAPAAALAMIVSALALIVNLKIHASKRETVLKRPGVRGQKHAMHAT